MKKLLFLSLALLVLFTTSCDKDEKEVPKTVTLEYASYELGVDAPLEIKAKLSVAPSEKLEIPFTLAGTTTKDKEYTVSAEKFVFEAGVREAVISITYKDNYEENASIKLALAPEAPYTVGEFKEANVSIGVGEKIVYTFKKATEQLADKIQIEIDVTSGGGKVNIKEPLKIPFLIKTESTAEYGKHFIVEGAAEGVQEFVLEPGKRVASITIKVLAYDAAKNNFTLVIDPAVKKFTFGDIAESAVEITPTVTSMMAGKWVGKSFDTEAYLKDAVKYYHPHDADVLPKNISAEDVITVELNGEKPSLKFNLKGDLKNYFRDCTMDYVGIVNDQEFYGTQPSPTEPPLRFDIAKYNLSCANVYFDATQVKETSANVGFFVRTVDGKEQLDVIIYDYAPKSFLVETFADCNKDYMDEWNQIRYTFVRE